MELGTISIPDQLKISVRKHLKFDIFIVLSNLPNKWKVLKFLALHNAVGNFKEEPKSSTNEMWKVLSSILLASNFDLVHSVLATDSARSWTRSWILHLTILPSPSYIFFFFWEASPSYITSWKKHLQSKHIKYSLPTSSENWLSADNPKNPYAIQKKINCFFPI